MVTVTLTALCLWLLLVLFPTFPSISAASELSLDVSGPTTLQLSPTLIVENSPGLRPGAKVKCERVLIRGLPRIKHLNKFANSVKVKVSCANQSGKRAKIEICFHRNVSLGVGMCPQDQWERPNNGLWIKSMSPFDHKILDVRMAASYSENLEVSLDEERSAYRILFLVSGIVLMSVASWLSNSLVFYYSGAMAIGIILLILVVLFQGMKLLPTGQKSLAVLLYSCFVGLGSFLLRYVPGLLISLLVEIGLSEDMYNPLVISLLVLLAIIGASLGFGAVRKLVLTKDGSIDIGVSIFVTWSIRFFAAVMILMSSIDPLLAAEALVAGIVVSSVLSISANRKVVRSFCKKLNGLSKINRGEPRDPYSSPVTNSSASRPFTRSPYTSPVQGSISKSPSRLSDSETFYSTFHETPERRKFTKGEWESFTKETTRKALEGLVSSPDFSKWAFTHADRITLAPKKEIADKQRRWFQWF